MLYKQINDFLNTNDIVFFLGDAIDRGPDSWRLFKAIMDNPQWIFLKGNHEDMFAKAIKEYHAYDGMIGDAWELSAYNGGSQTLEGWLADGSILDCAEVINKLPTIQHYYNINNKHIILSHAGFTPKHCGIADVTDYELIWSRSHFLDAWQEGNDDTYIIHGHTPTISLMKDIKYYPETFDLSNLKSIWYCNNHKCCIDLGSFKFRQTVLLDLDTFEEHYFKI